MSLDFQMRPRKTSWTLVVTFALGIAIGFSLSYALADALGWNFSAAPSAPPRGATATGKPPVRTETAAPATPAPAAAETPVEEAPSPASEICPGRHLFVGVDGTTLDASTAALLQEFKPTGVVLLSRDLKDEKQVGEFVRQIKMAAGSSGGLADPPLVAVAQEGGPDFNPFGLERAPSASELGRKDDPAATRAAASSYAAAARARGITVLLAPVLDVRQGGAGGFALGSRVLSAAPDVVARVGLDFAQALLDGGVSPVVKHYPGLSAAVPQANGFPTIPRSGKSEQEEMYALAQLLFPFSEAAGRGLPAMLAAHVAVPALDKEKPERPAALSPVLIQKVIRETWAYQGVILADDVTAGSIAGVLPPEEAAVQALAAGCDAVIAYRADHDTISNLCRAIIAACDEGGGLSREQLARSKARLEAWQTSLKDLGTPEAEEQPEGAPDKAETGQEGTAEELPEEAPPEVGQEGQRETEKATAEETPEGESTEGEAAPGIEAAPETAPVPVPGPAGAKTIAHRVRRGENLVGIAKDYGVGVSDLKAWNGLVDSKILYGQELLVYVPQEEPAPAPSEPEVGPEAPPATAEGQDETPAPSAAVAPPPDSGKRTHIVAEGETLAGIAATYGVAQADLEAWNELGGAEPALGTELRISPPIAPDAAAETPEPKQADAPQPDYEYYDVARGDTLAEIAAKFKTTQAELVRLNNLSNPNVVQMGQRLKVPRN